MCKGQTRENRENIIITGGKVTFQSVFRPSQKVSARHCWNGAWSVFTGLAWSTLCAHQTTGCHSNPTDAEGATPAISKGLVEMLKRCRRFHIWERENDIWPIGPMGRLGLFPTGSASGRTIWLAVTASSNHSVRVQLGFLLYLSFPNKSQFAFFSEF